MAKPKRWITFNCDVCWKECYLSQNQYNEQKQHCCSLKCRNELRWKNYLPWKRFWKLTVIKRWERKDTRGRELVCKCDCWNTTTIHADNRWAIKSCWCLWGKVTHWMTWTDEWIIWRWILERCRNKNHTQYYQYWGRGIKVWYKDFNEFYADMWDRPWKEYSIDRIDNSKWYEKGNCRRATMKEQSNNRRSNIKCIIDGESHTLQERADKLWMNRKTLKRYILKWKIKWELYNYKPDKWDTKSNAF